MNISEAEKSRIIEMAWEDRTPFEAIELQFGLSEPQVITFMRKSLKTGSFKLWRKRMHGRQTKHLNIRDPAVSRGYCPTQYKHSVPALNTYFAYLHNFPRLLLRKNR